jgi:hypothetical protein
MSHVVPLSRRYDIELERDRRESILCLGWLLYWHSGARLYGLDLQTERGQYVIISDSCELRLRRAQVRKMQQPSLRILECTDLDARRWSLGK